MGRILTRCVLRGTLVKGWWCRGWCRGKLGRSRVLLGNKYVNASGSKCQDEKRRLAFSGNEELPELRSDG